MPITDTSASVPTASQSTIASDTHNKVDVSYAARVIIATALKKLPYVGSILGALVTIFWPSNRDVWSEIKAKVEALIDQKIADTVWLETSNALKGLGNVLDDYLYAAGHFKDDPTVISEKWNAAQELFLHDLPVFQSKGYEVLLLPLFAQFANLHLTLLRDGILFGNTWGWHQDVVDGVKGQLSKAITDYPTYADATYQAGLEQTKKRAPSNKHKTEPFNTVNRFEREMTLGVLDFKAMWPYLDVVKYPDPVTVTVDREIYSDAFGTADDSSLAVPKPPKQAISRITVWGWDRIDAVKVDYPDGGGPNGATTTGRMGDSHGGADKPPHGGTFAIAQTGAVNKVMVAAGSILNAMQLTFEGGTTSHMLGGNYPGGLESVWQYPGEILSSIKVMGVSNFYRSADCAVFGFKYKDNQLPEPSAAEALSFFIGDPEQPDGAKLAAKLGLTGAAAEQVAGWAKDYGWDELRRLHIQRQAQRFKK